MDTVTATLPFAPTFALMFRPNGRRPWVRIFVGTEAECLAEQERHARQRRHADYYLDRPQDLAEDVA